MVGTCPSSVPRPPCLVPRVFRGAGLDVWPARILHVAWTWPRRDLYVARTWPGRGLDVAWTWSRRGLDVAWTVIRQAARLRAAELSICSNLLSTLAPEYAGEL